MWGLLQLSTGDRQAFPHPLPTGRRAGGAEMAEDVCGDVGGGEARELVVWRPVEGREAHGGGPLPADPEGLVQDPSTPPPTAGGVQWRRVLNGRRHPGEKLYNKEAVKRHEFERKRNMSDLRGKGSSGEHINVVA